MLLTPGKCSYPVLLLKKLSIKYRIFGDSLERIIIKSKIYKDIANLITKMKLVLRYSLFGRISEEKRHGNQRLLNESRVVQYYKNFQNNLKQRILISLSASESLSSVERFKKGFHLSPLRAAGLFMIIAVILNILLLLLVGDEISRSGWFIRGLFLLAGICSLGSPADWRTLKSNSLILKLFLRKCAGFVGK